MCTAGVYGGPVPDALTALCRLLATLHDERGDVAVPGLTRGSAGSGRAEPPDLTEAQFRAEAGVLDGVQLTGTGGLTDRLWAGPAIAVIGIDAPSVAAASNTLIPAARAKVSMRVAPGDDAAAAREALAAHLMASAPWGAQVSVQPGAVAAPFTARTGGRAYQAARSALEQAWGTAAVDAGAGGSIPFVTAYAGLFPDAEILITGVEDPGTRAHGANESLHLATFERACLAEALLLRHLALSRTAGCVPCFIPNGRVRALLYPERTGCVPSRAASSGWPPRALRQDRRRLTQRGPEPHGRPSRRLTQRGPEPHGRPCRRLTQRGPEPHSRPCWRHHSPALPASLSTVCRHFLGSACDSRLN